MCSSDLLASVIAMFVTSLLLLRSIIKIEHSFKINDVVYKICMIILNSIIMGVVIMLVIKILADKVNVIFLVGSGTAIGILVYFILGYIMKIQEVIELKNMFLRKIKK